MATYGNLCEFAPTRRLYPDGVQSNFEFAGYDAALLAWRYPDLTVQVEYMADVIDRTIRQEMRTEAGILQEWTTARRMVKDIIDGPDADIDRIIRSVRDNQGAVSNKLRKEFPVLDNAEIVADLVGVLKTAFKNFDGGSPTNELT
ncbi:hypothetical protein Tamer19_58210 [Cupriavidus sp. TA19]|uniref:hypothetical protein n=1 Tax=unclassified Cupriavidus TaxID=2640874 RepID=UPI000ECAB9E5|nr:MULTISPECIES: hypothetical protein [unclassified Cupriavidus]BDB29826.1 hypothetical protein CTP10_R72420 [Cupriavidus sp. P-10]GLC96412.1 hypothetical protein Tamer19_58210 [Cupriavidus sp. TA19]